MVVVTSSFRPASWSSVAGDPVRVEGVLECAPSRRVPCTDSCSLMFVMQMEHGMGRTALVEYYGRELDSAMALHGANAHVSAARLLDRWQPAVTEVLRYMAVCNAHAQS